MEPILLSWSGGKDCAMALYELRSGGGYEVAALLTTVTVPYDRVSMHGVRRELLERQAAAVGLPLEVAYIPASSTTAEYERSMAAALEKYRAAGIRKTAFGDIFLEDLRRYREEKLSMAGMEALFPLWKRDTAALAETFCALGFEAIVTCVDTAALDREFSGRKLDRAFFASLPETVDRCGENGEYHSFAYDGPIFSSPVRFETGERVLRDDRFYFCDLIPSPSAG